MKKLTTIFSIATLALVMFGVQTFGAQPIKGTVTYHEDPTKPLPSVIVQLWQNGVLLNEAITNINGKYIFPNVAYGEYTIKALNTPIEAGGVDQADAQLVFAYASSQTAPSQQIEFLAADVDQSGEITMEDYDIINNYWSTGIEPEWVFEDLEVSHTGTKDNVPTMGGSSSGDVNGTFVPTGRSEEIAIVNYFAKQFSSNFTVEIYAKDLTEASAMGLVIDYPSTVNVNSVTSPLGDINNLKIQDNQITATWVNDNYVSKNINSSKPVLVITGSTNVSYTGSDIKFAINNKSHFVNNGSAFKPEFSVPFLSVNGTENLSYSYPNPASESTVIYFSLPENAKASLDLYNLNGQLVKNILNDEISAGQHSVTLMVSDMQEGVYFYSLTTSGNVNINQAKRLVVVH
ncbi:MAG: T9SS type A sorting domain-containing protein [Chloroflexota bacterium]|nr:T9SS type A sorting domain-containing protein [Lentimicrobium sp.]